MPKQRAERIIKGEYIKCPYCKKTYHFDYIENLSYEEYLKQQDLKKNYERTKRNT